MLNSNVNYPYPLLREEPDDYKTTIFNDEFEILRENNGFKIVPRFSVNNKEIEKLLNNGALSYAVQIQCRSTWYRTLKFVKNNMSFMIDADKVHERVDLCPCIIAMKDIVPFVNADFVDEYQGIPIHLNKNDIIGIGKTYKFSAFYKSDEVKKPDSIITVNQDDAADTMKVSLDQPGNIHISLPKEQYEMYMRAGTSSNDQITLLHAVVHIPAIVLGLTVIDDENENDYQDYAWYKSLRAALESLSGGDPNKLNDLLDDPIHTAQLLLGNNIGASLKLIDDPNKW